MKMDIPNSDSDNDDEPMPTPMQKKASLQIDESRMCPIMVAVAGGSASGKTTLCNKLKETIGMKDLYILTLDSFYKGLEDPSKAKDHNFDHPDALDFDSAYAVLQQLMRREKTAVPIYNFKTHMREDETENVTGTDIILFEGIFSLYDKRIRELMNLKIFIHTDDDVRLFRRLLRDTKERGRTVESVLYQYNRFVKASFDDFIKPTMKYADLIVPGGASNIVAINFIVQNLRLQLSEFGDFKKNMRAANYYNYDIFENCWLNTNSNRNEADLEIYCARNVFFPSNDKMKKEFANLFLLFNKDFSLDLYEMVIRRYMKAGLRILRSKEGKNLEHYEFLTFPTYEDSLKKNVKDVDFICFMVIFFFENAFHQITKTIDSLLEKNPKLQISVIAAFSNIKYLTSLSKNHQNVKIINILCIADFRRFCLSLQKNVEISNVNLMQEEYYHTKLLRLAYKYRQKHSTIHEAPTPTTPTTEGESKTNGVNKDPHENASHEKQT